MPCPGGQSSVVQFAEPILWFQSRLDGRERFTDAGEGETL